MLLDKSLQVMQTRVYIIIIACFCIYFKLQTDDLIDFSAKMAYNAYVNLFDKAHKQKGGYIMSWPRFDEDGNVVPEDVEDLKEHGHENPNGTYTLDGHVYWPDGTLKE